MLKYIAKIERFFLRQLNILLYGGKRVSKNLPLMTGDELNQYIYDALSSDAPLMVARYGGVELDAALYTYICQLPLRKRYKIYIQRKNPYLRHDATYAQTLMNPLCNNAGFFPNDISLLKPFGEQLLYKDTPECSCCCCSPWVNEDLVMPFFNSQIKFGKLNNLEPYDYDKPWSRALAGKKVLVVHPFAKSIESQYARRDLLWENPEVLPEFELKTIKAVQSVADEKVPFRDWFEALHHMKQQMDAIDYDVAIIGCGAYGFSLAAHAKRSGKQAIHLGGATQILFGIKGKRWDEMPAVNKFYNDYWVYPLPEETPKNAHKVEGGCYW